MTTESVLAYSAEREEREKKREAEKQRMDTARKMGRRESTGLSRCLRTRQTQLVLLALFFFFFFLFLFCFLSSNDHFSSAVHSVPHSP